MSLYASYTLVNAQIGGRLRKAQTGCYHVQRIVPETAQVDAGKIAAKVGGCCSRVMQWTQM
jgi:hypothetical protein